MKNSTIVKAVLGLLLATFLFVFAGNFIGFSNTEISLRAQFEQKTDERTGFYDKMQKIFSAKTQIAVKNDESFRKNINAIMEGRKDAEGLMMKLVVETNPNANYQEVSVLYKDLSRTIEAQREGFFNQEKVMQDIVRQHKMHLQAFPNSFYNIFFDRQMLAYKVIQSDETKKVMSTGIDNNKDIEL